MILKEFQINAKEKILKFLDEKDGRIVVQSPTGSGKTIILCNVVKEYFDTHNKTVFVWFTPGAGELEEQSKEKFERFVPELTSKTLDEALRNGIEEKDIVFINWESVNKTDNKAIREGERKNLMERVSDSMEKGIKFILLIDEAHNSFTSKTQNLVADVFGKCQQIYVSATIDRKHFSHIDVEITEETKKALLTKRHPG
jgi:type III restriction enzyme